MISFAAGDCMPTNGARAIQLTMSGDEAAAGAILVLKPHTAVFIVEYVLILKKSGICSRLWAAHHSQPDHLNYRDAL